MNLGDFWEIIEKGKDSDDPESVLATQLEELEPSEIESFQDHFDSLIDKAYRWDLWGAAYMIGGGCSDDGFIDFRYALISKGKEVYERALENPDSLSDLGPEAELDNEAFGYVAQQVYEEIKGCDMPRSQRIQSEESMGEEWDFEDRTEKRKLND